MFGKIKKAAQFLLLYASGLWLLFRRFNRRKVTLLMYHGVSEQDVDVWTQVPVVAFDEQMAYLRDYYRVVPLETAVKMLTGGEPLPDRIAAITFDDGFLNNKTHAYPILKKYGLPATVFLTTSLIDDRDATGGLLWPDYVRCLLCDTTLTRLDMSDAGLGHVDLSDAERRTTASDEVCERLKTIAHDEKTRIIGLIAERTGVTVTPDEGATFRGLSWDDVRALDAEGLMSFGAHTVNHPILSRMDRAGMEREIVDSKRIIESHLGHPVTTFAYPNGKKTDYTDETVQIARENFICALTTTEGLNAAGDDLYELQRVGPGAKTSLWEFKLLTSRAITVYHRLKNLLGG